MKNFAYKFIIITMLIVLCLFAFAGCSSKLPDGSDVNDETREWISPDGVHYWYWRYWDKSNGYGWVLAPRYDWEGNLVKEIHEPRI